MFGLYGDTSLSSDSLMFMDNSADYLRGVRHGLIHAGMETAMAWVVAEVR